MPASPTSSVLSGEQSAGWAEVAADAPQGLALIAGDGRFVRLNRAAVALCGQGEADMIGRSAPFTLPEDRTADPDPPFDAAALEPAERVTVWAPAPGARREFAYRARRLAADPTLTAVSFRDVTDERHQQRRVTAIARSSANLASSGSLIATLDALAEEVLRADALAGVQILTADGTGRGPHMVAPLPHPAGEANPPPAEAAGSLALRLMGSAGFHRRPPDFFDRLLRCRDRGATLHTLNTFETAEPVVVPNRWAAVQDDPAWEPLHVYMREPRWDWFASVPLMVRGRVEGILNAYFAPGQVVGERTLEFLIAMADQAAVAVDYAALLQREREEARQRERRRLARDLHDSIVQQVFAIGMQAKAMGALGERGSPVPPEVARRVAAEVGGLSHAVLADLRAMVHELRPTASTDVGLENAVRALVESTTHRTGLHFSTVMGKGLQELAPDLAEDVYRIVAEGVHNVVKHADATGVVLRLGVRGRRMTASVSDDGHGLGPDAPPPAAGARGGYGFTTMRERAERWGGTLTITSRRTVGTTVRAVIPMSAGEPRTADAPTPPAPSPTRPETS